MADSKPPGAASSLPSHTLSQTSEALPTLPRLGERPSGIPASPMPEAGDLTLPVFAEETTQTSMPLPLQRSRIPCLTVITGPEEGEHVSLEDERPAVIGRGQDCRLRLTDGGVSRQHARVFATGGLFFVEDLGSTNGTFVGETRVKLHQLQDNDLVRIGTTTIVRFRLMDALEAGHLERVMAAALRDALTGLFNRRCFDERLAAEHAASRRHGRPLALMIFDVDNFKKVNDNFGHVVGDGLLRAIAGALRQGVRQEDQVFRYGGEEFAVLARETPLEGAVLLAERLRQAVATTKANGLKATVSIGLAMLAAGKSIQELIETADARLYRAKREGKNRVVYDG